MLNSRVEMKQSVIIQPMFRVNGLLSFRVEIDILNGAKYVYFVMHRPEICLQFLS